MKKKQVFKIVYEFDNPHLKAVWLELMAANGDSMAIGLGKMMKELGHESDPAIYVKGEENLVVIKKINTDRGFVLSYSDDKKKSITTKPYKLIANGESYMTLLEGQLLIYFRRTGGVDELVEGLSFTSIDDAVLRLKDVLDPEVRKAEIAKRDAEWEKMNPEDKKKVEKELGEMKLEGAIPKV